MCQNSLKTCEKRNIISQLSLNDPTQFEQVDET